MLRSPQLVIDPLNTKDSTQSDLLSMVLDQNRISVFHKETVYFIEWEDPATPGVIQKIGVNLTNDIVCLEKQTVSGVTKESYCVISNKPEDVIGHGSIATKTKVVRVAVTLKQHRDGSIEAKTDKHRIVKIQQHSEEHTLEDTLREAEMLKIIPDAHGKNIVVEDHGNGHVTSYLVDEEFRGIELFKLYEEGFLTDKASTEMRFKVANNMLRALYQFHQRGLAHRDLKPENFLVDPATCEIRLIDPGLAAYIDANDKRQVGTKYYSAPEFFSRKYVIDDKSDVYSIGLLLLPIFKGWWRDSEFENKPAAMINAGRGKEQILMPDWDSFPTISLTAATKMTNALRAMFALNPNDRLAMQKVVETFDDGYLQHKLKWKYATLTDTEKTDITTAHRLGLDLFFQLLDIENNKCSRPSLSAFATLICNTVNQLADSPNVINEFVETLKVKAFAGIVTKKDLLVRINKIVTDFENTINTVINLFTRIDLDMAEYVKILPEGEVNLTRRKLLELCIAANDLTDKPLKRKRRMSIDQMVDLTKALNDGLAELISAVENIEKEVCEEHVESYASLAACLRNDETTAVSDLASIKKKLKQVITDYVNDILTPAIIEPGSRNDAIKYSAELEKYVKSIDTANDITSLQQTTLMQPDQQVLLSFTMFGKATLRTRLQAALDERKQIQPS